LAYSPTGLKSIEANSLLGELKKNSMTSYRASLLSLYSGMRFGEIAGLRWQHVDVENRQIVILDPKNGKTRFSFMAAVNRLNLNDGVEDRRMKVVFHTRRHSCASQLAMSGADLPTIQAPCWDTRRLP